MKFAMSLLAVAGIAAAANAATTLAWEVSTDNGATWGPAAALSSSGDVRIRLTVSLGYDHNLGPERGEIGFAGINVLPQLSNFGAGDSVAALGTELTPEGSSGNPFGTRTYGASNLTVANAYFDPTFSGNVNAYVQAFAFNGAGVPRGDGGGGHVIPQTPGFGRQAPFAANGTGSNGVPVSSVAGGNLEWRAGVISNGGVSFVQQAAQFSSISAIVVAGKNTAATTDDVKSTALRGLGSTFPAGMQDLGDDFLGLSNLVLFEYGITLDASSGPRTLVQSCNPLINAKWFTSAAGTTSVEDGLGTGLVVVPASISIVPAPGAIALLGLGGLVAGRRRR